MEYKQNINPILEDLLKNDSSASSLMLNIVDYVNDAIAVVDTKYKIHYCNKAFKRIFCDNKSAEFQSLSTFFDSDSFEIIHNLIQNDSSNKDLIHFSNNHFHTIIYEVFIQNQHNTDFIFLTFQEVSTEEKIVSKDILDFQLLADNFKEQIWLCDFELNLKYINPYSRLIFGYSNEEIKQLGIYEIYTPSSIETVHNELNRQLLRISQGLQPETPIVLELQAIHKNNSIIDIEVTAELSYNSGGKPNGIQGISRDITDRKVNQKLLELSRENFRNSNEFLNIALDIANMAWWDFDIQSNIIRSHSGKMKELFGLDNLAAPQKLEDIYYYVHPEDLLLFSSTHKRLVSGEIDKFEIQYRLRHALGSYKWVMDRGKTIKYDIMNNPIRAIGIMMDKTNEIEYWNKLNESENKYRLLFENMFSGFALHELIYDENGNPIDYKYLDVNPAYEQLIGRTYEEVINRNAKDLFPNVEKEWIEMYDKVATTMQPDFMIQHSSDIGKYYEVFAFAPQEGQCATIFNDATERILLENEIKRNEIRLKTAERIAKMGSWELDIESYEFKYSDELPIILGYEASEKLSLDSIFLQNIIYKDDIEKLRNTFTEAIRNKTDFNCNYRIIRNGEIVYLDSKASHFDIGGKTKLIGTLIDVSERKQFEAELIKAKHKAEESDKLKSAFLANVSHEIRTPMNSIVGFLNLIADAEIPEIEKQQFISIVRNSSSHLLDIINDVIDISKIESGDIELQFQNIDIKEIFEDIYKENMMNAKTKGIALELKSNGLFTKIYSDKKRLKQILTNLVSNAIKFTDYGKVTFGYEKIDKQLVIKVKDTGIGIAESNHKIIFERFRQVENYTTKIYKGTGLGLSIVKAIIEKLDGKIELQSEIGKGSEFTVYLPIKEQIEEPKQIQKFDNELSYNWDKFSVLIVEDEIHNYILLERLLRKTKIETLFADSIQKALEKINSIKTDIVLLDIKLGKDSGYTLLNILKETHPHLPVIAQSAFALQEDIDKGLAAGFYDYVVKPISPELLLNKMNKFLLEKK